MNLSVKRINLTGNITEILFDKTCWKYLVKNFSDGDIFVSFTEDLVEDSAIKIPSGMGQVVVINEHFTAKNVASKSVIYIKGTGEVEVQQLCYN